MMALGWNGARGAGDLALGLDGGVADDPGLASAVLLSLFLDRRAEADDLVDGAGLFAPGAGGALFARRGWVGDALSIPGAAPGDRIGSRLWLLARAKQVDETLRLAEDYAREALDWLVADGLAAEVAVAAAWIARGVMELTVTVSPPAGDQQVFTYGLRTL
jgi:phage gp46-like protein